MDPARAARGFHFLSDSGFPCRIQARYSVVEAGLEETARQVGG